MLKKLIKSILFLIIFCVLFYSIFNILWLDKFTNGYFHIESFYKEPQNSLDIVYVGASNVYTSFNTVLAYDLYGYTTGVLSAGNQPFPLIKYLIKESEKSQNPKLYIIDIVRLVDDLNSISDENMRKSVDCMNFSANRIDAINELLSYKHVDKSNYINYYLSFFIYHNGWKNISKNNFLNDTSVYNGYLFQKKHTKTDPQKPYIWKDTFVNLPPENKQVLINLIDFIKSSNLNVLFVITPRTYKDEENDILNDAISVINENNLDIINFNTLEDFKIDFSKDLYNSGHLNVYGATKYTLYFSKYLKEHYDLPDHRNDPKYASWNSEYERFKQSFKSLTKKDFDKLLDEYTN